MYELRFSKTALNDGKLLQAAKLDKKINKLLDILERDPFQNPPPYEPLNFDLQGFYSRRINQKHRLVYRVNTETNKVYIHRMWTHYDL